MFRHIFINRFKCIIRDRQIIFWSMLFPLILATLFNFSIRNITQQEVVSNIPVAIVENENEETQMFKKIIEEVEKDGELFFDVAYIEEGEAQGLLEEEKVDAVIAVNDTPELTVRENGIKETIIKTFADEFVKNKKIIETMMVENPAGLEEITEILNINNTYTIEKIIGKNKPDIVLNYFYSLIGMACLYGSFLGMKEIISIQGNLSKEGARLNMAPVSKIKQFLAGYLAAYCISLAEMIVLMSYLILVLKIDFGTQFHLIILTIVISSAMSIALGGFVGGIGRIKEGTRMGILIGGTMIGSAMAGLMNQDIRYMIGNEMPILMYINPVSLITNSFYALYYYEDYTKYYLNISLLFGLTIILIWGTYGMVRRKKYVSI